MTEPATSAPRQRSAAPLWVAKILQPFLESHIGDGWSSALREWRFESRYFSSLIVFAVDAGPLLSGRFVAKLPKAARGRGFAQVPARVPADLELAAQEYKAFLTLGETWPRGETAFVEPRFYHDSSGMLVFDYLDGRDLYARALPRRLCWRKPPTDLVAKVRSIGHALAEYHTRAARQTAFDHGRLIAKIEASATELRTSVPGLPTAATYRDRITAVVPGIKGFELRNARVAGGRVWLFDPGRVRDEPPEADIARFLVSLRMCGWGTPYFTLPLDTKSLETAFMEGYLGGRTFDALVLELFLLRELLWNWREGRDVIASKKLPPALRALTTRLYVETPFRRLWLAATAASRST